MSDGTTTWTYTYDADGMRTSRTNGTDTYTYVYNGGLLTQMTKGEDTLFFTYDAMGMPATVTHNGTVYFYLTTLQGDVLGIVDTNDNIVVEYITDAWGKICYTYVDPDCPIAELNPLIYRGYVYDIETGLYYLQSRCYSPNWGRFVNLDMQINGDLGMVGNNLFAYCLNNPVSYVDEDGKRPGELFSSPDAAAEDAARYMYELGTFRDTHEYGATIYTFTTWETKVSIVKIKPRSIVGKLVLFFNMLRGRSDTVIITSRVKVTRYSYNVPRTFGLKNFILPPAAFNAVAMIHSHPYVKGYGYDSFSDPDKMYAALMNMPYYLYTATGRLLKYNPKTDIVREIETETGLPSDPHIP